MKKILGILSLSLATLFVVGCEKTTYESTGDVFEAETYMIQDYQRGEKLFNANTAAGMAVIDRIYVYKDFNKISVYTTDGFASSSFGIYEKSNFVDNSRVSDDGKMIYDMEFDIVYSETKTEHFDVYVDMSEKTITVDGKEYYDRLVIRSNSSNVISSTQGEPVVYEMTMPMSVE